MKDAIRNAFSIFDDYELRQDIERGILTVEAYIKPWVPLVAQFSIKDFHEWERAGELEQRLEEFAKGTMRDTIR